MGDRGNIYFVDGAQSDRQWRGVYMYSHWRGGELPSVVQRALRRGRGRWGDAQYLARMMFCELLDGDLDGETGYGLSTQLGDNEHPIVRVNDVDGTVAFCRPGTEADRLEAPMRSWAYDEFVQLADPDRAAPVQHPTEEQVLSAAREVLGKRCLEWFTNEETGVVEMFVVVNVATHPLPPDQVDLVGLRKCGIEAEVGDELLFPIYYLPQDEARAVAQDPSIAMMLGYPRNVFEVMARALARMRIH